MSQTRFVLIAATDRVDVAPRGIAFGVVLVWLLWIVAGPVHAEEHAHAGPAHAEVTQAMQPSAAAQQTFDVESVPADERPARRRHTALLIAGASTFVSSYLVTAFVAATVGVVNASDCEAGNIVEPCHDGSLMLVPLVGPFLTSRSFDEQLGLAGPQIAGALLAVTGIFHYMSRPLLYRERASLEVYPVPLPTGGMLRTTLTF